MSVSGLRQRLAAPLVAGAAGAALYLLTPAAASAPLGAWPLTPPGTVAFAAAIAIAYLAWQLPVRRQSWLVAAAFAVLIIVRALTAVTASEPGWLASYHANDAWAGRPEWSSDFRLADATRIDRALAFAAGDFPVHYLNGPAFSDAPPDRDVATPMTVRWSGAFVLDRREAIAIELRSMGESSVSIDGSPALSTEQAGARQITLEPGSHAIEVRYRKPAGVPGALQVDLRDENGNAIDVFVTASGASPVSDRVTFATDAVTVLILAVVTGVTLWRAMQSASRLTLSLGAALVAGLGLQGWFAARPFTRFYTLTAGDDWLGFESRARNILQHGLLMPLDAAPGAGVPYFYHPFYSYALAGVHALTGESLFGAIFLHFLVLAITAVVMFTLLRRLFGMTAAIAGVAALVAIFELDFVRYYTVTLLSENLYVLTVTCCLAAFARWAESGRTAWLVGAGIWGGISAATRPVMMVFLPFALAVAFAIALRYRRSPGPIGAPLALGGAWMACVLPFTVRNWIVSKQFVLISAGQGGAVIEHNVPKSLDPAPYLAAFRSGAESTVSVLWRLLIEHPSEVLALQFKKLGFTLGMIHWFEGYRPHPELVAVTLLYLAMLVMSRTMRRPELWPVHAFVVSHWGSMLLTSPWNYGYRLILPAYVYTSALAVAAAVAWLWPMMARRTAFAGELR